jgi:hypothetical protein
MKDDDPVLQRVVEMRLTFGPGSGFFDCFSAKSAMDMMLALQLTETQLSQFFWDMEMADGLLKDTQLAVIRQQLTKKGFMP